MNQRAITDGCVLAGVIASEVDYGAAPLHIFYARRVQGVGFRFAAKMLARGFEVTGVVRNLPDGRVECWRKASERLSVLERQDSEDRQFTPGRTC